MKRSVAILISALVLVLATLVIYDKYKDTKHEEKIDFHDARVSNGYVELLEQYERAVIDDKLTIDFYGVGSDSIYTYTAKIYYNGKLIENDLFTNENKRIIDHSSAQIGGMHVTKINNLYFISSVISPAAGSALLIIGNGSIINTFERVFFDIDYDNNILEVYDNTTIDKKYNILDNDIKLIKE